MKYEIRGELLKMLGDIAGSLLIILIFIMGSTYHFRIRAKSIYPIKMTKKRVIISIIVLCGFYFVAFIGGNQPGFYVIATMPAIYIISGAVAEGISERGIYYRPLGVSGHLIRLAKWADIKNVKFDLDKSKLESFKLKTETIFPDQCYNSEDINKIKKYIERKTNLDE